MQKIITGTDGGGSVSNSRKLTPSQNQQQGLKIVSILVADTQISITKKM